MFPPCYHSTNLFYGPMKRGPPCTDLLLFWSWMKQQRRGCQALYNLSLASLFSFMVDGTKLATILYFSLPVSLTAFVVWVFGSLHLKKKKKSLFLFLLNLDWAFDVLCYLSCDRTWQKWWCVSSEVRPQELWLPPHSLGPHSVAKLGNQLEDKRPHRAEISNSNVSNKTPDLLGVPDKINKIADMSLAVRGCMKTSPGWAQPKLLISRLVS